MKESHKNKKRKKKISMSFQKILECSASCIITSVILQGRSTVIIIGSFNR
jgi:hypothetical protein